MDLKNLNKLAIGLIVVSLLLVGCSSTSVSPVYDDAELLKEKDLSLSYWNENEELRELLAEEKDLSLSYLNRIEDLESGEKLDRVVRSYGPCGDFILDGKRILKLEFDSSLGPWVGASYDDFRAFEDSIQWVDTGASRYDPDSDSDLLRRPPNVIVLADIDSAPHPFFWLKWGGIYEFPGGIVNFGLPEDEDNWEMQNWEGIVGANSVNYAGFFGPDKDCNWDWVPIENSMDSDGNDVVPGSGYASSTQNNSSISLDEDGKQVFVWKDYSCPDRAATAVYNPELHLFVSDCGW